MSKNRRPKEPKAPPSLALLCKTITSLWSNDIWKPNVTIAWVDTDHLFYASIVRYPEGIATKTVVLKAREKTMDAAIAALAASLDAWVERQRVSNE